MGISNKIRKIDNMSTVFTIADIQALLNESDQKSIYNALSYSAREGEIYKISDGIYALSMNYSKKEFANKYRKPSYISLYTVLQENGVVFQPYSSIYVITNRFEEAEFEGQKYIYRKIKDEILLNPFGIENTDGVAIASTERAICDKLYLDGDEYFDNLRNIRWDFMKALNEKVFQQNLIISEFITKYSK